MKPYALMLGAVVVLAGCASEPNVYYTLTAPIGQQSQSALSQPVGPYTIGPVVVPAQVDDSMLVVRRNADELIKLAHDRWSAPLGKQIDNALAVQLTHLLGAPPLSRAQAAASTEQVSHLTLDVRRFDLVPAQYAALSVVWQIAPPAGATQPPRLMCYTELREAVSAGVAPLVQAQQLNINRLAQTIGQAWSGGPLDSHTRCQSVS
jgi:uncharacterized lipoprotein YmbA